MQQWSDPSGQPSFDDSQNSIRGTAATFDTLCTHGKWRVTAMDGTGVHDPSQSGWRSYAITAPAAKTLATPVLASPSDNQVLKATGDAARTTFTWQLAPGAARYRMELAPSGGPANVIDTAGTSAVCDVDQDGKWRVTALGEPGVYSISSPSAWRNYTVDVLPQKPPNDQGGPPKPVQGGPPNSDPAPPGPHPPIHREE